MTNFTNKVELSIHKHDKKRVCFLLLQSDERDETYTYA